MRKEIIVAIVFGVILGLGVATFMIFNLKKANTQNATTLNKLGPSPLVKNQQANLQPLEISAPANNSIFNIDQIKIKGKAPKDSLMVVQSPIKEVVFKNAKVDFEITFPLSLGENKITIASYDAKNVSTPQVKTLNLYYLDEQ